MLYSHHNHTSSCPHTSITVNFAPSHSVSRHTCNTNNSTRITITATTARPNTTTWPQTQHSTWTQTAGQHKRNQKQTQGAQTAYSRHTCGYHHNSGNQANTPKLHNFTTVRADRLHKAGGGLITLIRDNITFTTTDIPTTINTHNTELQMVNVHINNTKYITIANICIPPRDSTSTHYKPLTSSTSQTYHTQSSPDMWTHTPLSGTRTLITIQDK